ncbi:MAG: CoA transferase [Acidobacteria bacterium]|nr:CoA transferase [Acidobacteriota bacterium]
MSPLDGLVVLDLSRILAGPYGTMILGDMGAEIIKIEEPSQGDDTRRWGPPFINGESTYFLSVNRNKKSITLNLKHDRGKEILWRLIEKADVLVENFRPGTLARLGFGFETVAARRPELIYCSISGYGQSGPRGGEAGFDVAVQGECGVMSVTGLPEGPPIKMGISIADIVAGMYAVQGILLSLIARGKTGKGQRVDIALLDGMISTLTYQAGIYFGTGRNPVRLGNRHPSLAPYEPFRAKDDYIIIAVGNEGLWQRFCEAISSPELSTDVRFATGSRRVDNYAALRQRLDPIIAARPADEWLSLFRRRQVPCGLVRSVEQALNDPQLKARNMIAEIEHPVAGPIKMVGCPIHLSETPASVRIPPPRLGQDNEPVYREYLGFSAATLNDLRAAGVI